MEEVKLRPGNMKWITMPDSDLKHLIASMLLPNPSHRPTIAQVLAHPYFNE